VTAGPADPSGAGPASANGDGRRVGLLGTTAIGIGGMVGGGIFAVLGTAVQLAGGGTPVAFTIAGIVALLSAYSYAQFSRDRPGAGGTVAFIDRAFGVDLWSGSVNLLLWFSYLVTVALYARAFGAYGARLLTPDPTPLLEHTLLSAAIALPLAINLFDAQVVSRAETSIVIVKLAILALVVVAGAGSVDAARFEPAQWPPLPSLVVGGMVIFVAYEGFELIANAGDDVVDPKRTLPRSLYLSVVLVTLLYVLLAAVTVGSLAPEAIARQQEYALAAAARPSLGQVGFVLVGIAALLSTASAINATIYGNARLTLALVRDHELPELFDRRLRTRPVAAVLATGLLSLGLANAFDVRAIAIVASAGFLLIFTAVNLAALRLAPQIGASRAVALLAALATSSALATLVLHANQESPHALPLIAGSLVGCVLVEFASQRVAGVSFSRPVPSLNTAAGRLLRGRPRLASAVADGTDGEAKRGHAGHG